MDNPSYPEIFELIRTKATCLQKLSLVCVTKPEVMNVLNKEINKESNLTSLSINFVSPQAFSDDPKPP